MRTVAHSLMVYARVLEVYVHFALIYRTDHIFTVLPIKDLINEDGDSKTPNKLATGTKPSVSNLRVLFFPCVIRKATAHVETKTRKYDTEGFVPVVSLCGVFGSPSLFIRYLIGRTGKIRYVVYINDK